jgi:hypothetical protein
MTTGNFQQFVTRTKMRGMTHSTGESATGRAVFGRFSPIAQIRPGASRSCPIEQIYRDGQLLLDTLLVSIHGAMPMTYCVMER